MRYRRRRNPATDHEGFDLSERQVREIIKLIEEIKRGWHTHEWFMDMLRMPGSDKQVVRYILASVDFIGKHARIHPRVEALERYLEELDIERHPEIDLDLDHLQELVKSQAPAPYIQDLIDRLGLALENLELARRLKEPRSSIHALKTHIQGLGLEIDYALQDYAQPEAEHDEIVEAPAAAEFDCNVCGEETFDYLKPEQRADIVDLSSIPEVAEAQHQLRHLVMEYHDAVENRRAQTYIFSLEDDMEDAHAALERIRAKHGLKRRRRNPAPLSDFIPTPEEEEEIKDTIFNALYHSGAYALKKEVFIDALIDQLSKLPYISQHHLDEIRKQSVSIAHQVESNTELADAIYEGMLMTYPYLMGIGEKPWKITYYDDGTWSAGGLEDDDDDDRVIDADYEI